MAETITLKYDHIVIRGDKRIFVLEDGRSYFIIPAEIIDMAKVEEGEEFPDYYDEPDLPAKPHPRLVEIENEIENLRKKILQCEKHGIHEAIDPILTKIEDLEVEANDISGTKQTQADDLDLVPRIRKTRVDGPFNSGDSVESKLLTEAIATSANKAMDIYRAAGDGESMSEVVMGIATFEFRQLMDVANCFSRENRNVIVGYLQSRADGPPTGTHEVLGLHLQSFLKGEAVDPNPTGKRIGPSDPPTAQQLNKAKADFLRRLTS